MRSHLAPKKARITGCRPSGLSHLFIEGGTVAVCKTIGFLRLLAFVSTLLFGMRSIALAQADLTGYWKYSVPNGGVNYLELKQAGNDIYINGRSGMSQTPYGSLHGDSLHMEIPSPFDSPNSKRFTVYDAIVKGDKFPATKKLPDEELTTGILERVTQEEAHPARLPLPELRDLSDNGLARTPPMGWNSWNRYHDKFDDATVRGMADAMVSSTPCFSIQSARHFSI